MKGQSEHTITAWLRRWLQGDARAADERRLDNAAAGDDFLREALEGLRRHPETDHAAATDRLRRRLQARTRRRRGGVVVLLPRIAAAASVALLLGLAWWWWRPAQTPEELAATEQTQPESTPENSLSLPDSSLAALTERPAIDQPQPAAKGEIQPATQKNLPAPALRPLETEEAESQTEAATIAAVPEPLEQTTKQAIALNDSVEPVAAPTAPRAAPLPGARRDTGPRLLHGQVLTPEGEPLIGANVILKGTATGVVTDIDGRFTLTLPEQQPSILINYLGYANREVAIPPGDDSLRIVLSETPAAADEVLVTGLSRAKRPAAGITKEVAPAKPAPQPVGGFKELEKYLRKNLVYPDAARRQRIAGTVRLEFRVQPDGTLTDFRVLDSLGYGCDAEAIRLLREGPKWQNPGGQTVPATYEVRFELPRK